MPTHPASRHAWPATPLAALLIAACTAQPPAEPAQRRPQHAGQPMDPLTTAGHIAGARVAALAGDREGVQRSLHAMGEDMRRAMKLPDAARPIDREAARTAARNLPGVRSVAWIDRSNLLVRVASADLRSHHTIDALCLQLEPLGDTLGAVVHVQNAAARTREQMDTLSRNCQLADGDRALAQTPHQLDVLDPALRARHQANVERLRSKPQRKHDAGDRAAVEAIPEM